MKASTTVDFVEQTRRDQSPATITNINEYRIERFLNTPASVIVCSREENGGPREEKSERMFSKALMKDLFPAITASVREGRRARRVPVGAIVVIRRTDGSHDCLVDETSKDTEERC